MRFIVPSNLSSARNLSVLPYLSYRNTGSEGYCDMNIRLSVACGGGSTSPVQIGLIARVPVYLRSSSFPFGHSA